jgi:hypothetical protein
MKNVNIKREKEPREYDFRISKAHLRVVEIASEVDENVEESRQGATNELVLKFQIVSYLLD